jgi:hypothetical protein
MRKIIDKKTYDTSTAKLLGVKHVGEYGNPDGYEEQLFITKSKQHFIYGIGGLESVYKKPAIKLIDDKQADEWKKDNKKDNAE